MHLQEKKKLYYDRRNMIITLQRINFSLFNDRAVNHDLSVARVRFLAI